MDYPRMTNLYFSINSTKIGGSEKRSMRIAEALALGSNNLKIHFVLPNMLLEVMEADEELRRILEESSIDFLVYDQGEELTTKRNNGRLMWLYKNKKYFPSFILKALIKRYSESFYNFMRSRLNEGDIYHHIFGLTGLASSLRLNHKEVQRICELTSPVYGPVVCHYWKLFGGVRNKKLKLLAVSEVISGQVEKYVATNSAFATWMRQHLSIYPIPFLKDAPILDFREKENLMVFASNFFDRKNPVLFANAIAALFKEGKLQGWKVFIRGKGPLEPVVRKALKAEIDKGRVEVGFSSRLEKEFERSKIYVSIISTGNYPSQSAFEAYARGNILLLSDRGNSRDKFTHPAFQFVDLGLEEVKQGIVTCVEKAEVQDFPEISKSIQSHYRENYDSRKVLEWLRKVHSNY